MLNEIENFKLFCYLSHIFNHVPKASHILTLMLGKHLNFNILIV
jgi:hypothetical protein